MVVLVTLLFGLVAVGGVDANCSQHDGSSSMQHGMASTSSYPTTCRTAEVDRYHALQRRTVIQ